jgi:hypothetical protein
MADADLGSLRARLVEERALRASARPSGAGEEELDRAVERVGPADAALAEGQVDVAARLMAEQAYVAGDSWPHSDLGAEVLRCSQSLSRLAQRS